MSEVAYPFAARTATEGSGENWGQQFSEPTLPHRSSSHIIGKYCIIQVYFGSLCMYVCMYVFMYVPEPG